MFVFHIICVTGCCCKCYGKGGTIQGRPSPQIFEGKTDGLSLRGEAQGPFCLKFTTTEHLQVLGHAPYSGMQTEQLCNALIKQMHAPDDVERVYVRHLALFVRFC